VVGFGKMMRGNGSIFKMADLHVITFMLIELKLCLLIHMCYIIPLC